MTESDSQTTLTEFNSGSDGPTDIDALADRVEELQASQEATLELLETTVDIIDRVTDAGVESTYSDATDIRGFE